MSVSGFYRHRARLATGVVRRTQESGRLIAARIAIGLPILFSVLAFIVRPALISWSYVSLPTWARWLGVGLGGCCIALVYWVMASLGSNVSETVLTKSEHTLVTHGPYRWIRHPLYTTGLLLLTAFTLITASWLIAALTVAAGIGIRYVVIPKEESALIEKFGDTYRQYVEHTGRLMPRLGT